MRSACCVLAACAALICGSSEPARADSIPDNTPAGVISIESIRLSAAGSLVDMRYRVLDPEKAQRMLGPKIRPKLIDTTTGVVMSVPTTAKLGALRQTQGIQRTGRTYFVLFVNSARVAPGSRVTVELGELRFPDLVVE